MMKLGMISGTDDASFDRVKNFGLEFIECCCNDDNDSRNFIAKVESVKANTARTGIGIQCVGRWNGRCNVDGKLSGPDYVLMEQLMDAAIAVGSPNFVCGCNYVDSVSPLRNYAVALDLFGRLLDHAKGKNIQVGVVNCDWGNFVVSPEQWKLVMGELPDLKIKYDCSHCYNRGGDYLAELAEWGDKVCHLHVKGTTYGGHRKVDDPPAGMDDIRWRSVFAILYDRKYDGGLSIEPHSGTWHGELCDKGICFTRDFIRPFIL